MHTVDGWPADFSVTEPRGEVWVNGAQREVVEVSLTKDIGDTLSGGDGLIAATGEVALNSTTGLVGARQITPWSPLAPRAGQGVSVALGYGSALAPSFIGVADGDAGGSGENTVLEVVDDFAKLDQTITLDPLMSVMPPWYDNGGFRRIGVTPTHVTTTVLRMCGYYATPAARGGTMLSVPMNGSMNPDVGRVIRCNPDGGLPVFESSAWGQSARGVVATYELNDTANLGQPFEMQMLVGLAGTSGNANVDVSWGSDYIRLLVTPARAVYLAERIGGVSTNVCILSTSQMAGAEHVYARVSQSGTWSLVADNGQTVTASRAFTRTAKPDTATINAPALGPQIGGVLVGFHGTFPPTFKRTAKVTPAAASGAYVGTPAIVRRKASEFLREQAAAELAAIWVDDHGVVQWKNRYRLVSGVPVREITATSDLLSLRWRTPSRVTTNKITVTYRKALASRATQSTITVFEGSKDALESGQQMSVMMEPKTDEDWIMPDLGAEWLTTDAERLGGFNRGRRSWAGMVKVTDPGSGGEPIETWVPGEDVVYEKVDPRTFVCTLTAPSLTANQTAELRSHSFDTALWPQYRNTGLPLLRSYGLLQWVDESRSNTSEANGLSENTHDASWFVQNESAATQLLNDIAARVLFPQPILEDVPVIPDARLERGDIITLKDPIVTGIDLRCLIEGITVSSRAGEQDMTLKLRILQVNGVTATYAELESVWSQATYSQLEGQWAGKTYAEFESNPLKKD